MTRLTKVLCVVLCVVATIAFAESEKPIDDVRNLAGDWRSVGGASPAAIRINEDGTYDGIAASGARTSGKITVTGGKASYRSNTSAGTVTLSEHDGNDALTFVRSDGRGSAELRRVK